MRFSFVATLFALLPALVSASSKPTWDDPSTTLYVTSPSCGFYKCAVYWSPGQTVTVNWLNSPKGNVKIQLDPTGSGKSYLVAASVPGTQSYKQCDGGNGVGKKGRPCGAYTFKVPSTWKPGNYSISVHSLTSKYIGYTDIVKVGSAKGTKSGGGKIRKVKRSVERRITTLPLE